MPAESLQNVHTKLTLKVKPNSKSVNSVYRYRTFFVWSPSFTRVENPIDFVDGMILTVCFNFLKWYAIARQT